MVQPGLAPSEHFARARTAPTAGWPANPSLSSLSWAPSRMVRKYSRIEVVAGFLPENGLGKIEGLKAFLYRALRRLSCGSGPIAVGFDSTVCQHEWAVLALQG